MNKNLQNYSGNHDGNDNAYPPSSPPGLHSKSNAFCIIIITKNFLLSFLWIYMNCFQPLETFMNNKDDWKLPLLVDGCW